MTLSTQRCTSTRLRGYFHFWEIVLVGLFFLEWEILERRDEVFLSRPFTAT